jgi:hypothetical protein
LFLNASSELQSEMERYRWPILSVAEREEAFAIARNWIKSGHMGVKVIGDDRIGLRKLSSKKWKKN